MSEILSIFKKIKAQVRQLDEKLSFYSKKVVSLNKDLNFYYSSNKFDSSDQSLTIIQINNNIKDLKTVKENMTNLLNELQEKNISLFNENVTKLKSNLNLTSFKEINSSSSNETHKINQTFNENVNFTYRKEIDSLLQFDILFSLIKDIHRSHKLKMTNRNAHNLTEIQKQTNIHFKILSNNSQVNFSSPNINLSNISQNSSESSKNKTIEETLEDVASIKSNFKSVLETVELDSNVLYNLNQKNKLQKMNLENYLIEQISFLKNVINDIKKTRFWISKLEIFQNESKRTLVNFEKLANSSANEAQIGNLKKNDFITNKLFDNLSSKNEFY